ncbi:hypothetical protein [Guillardia theta]|uniref:Uncharacterized protein n=1 Tax=Guillardia theta TaxID=55529 RepID=Q9AVZ9_GUITH|nr:hypothetical protein GTHECHR2168 [Guillardia theta]CAC27072.1 hypothetical protein [Guillardia theta]
MLFKNNQSYKNKNIFYSIFVIMGGINIRYIQKKNCDIKKVKDFDEYYFTKMIINHKKCFNQYNILHNDFKLILEISFTHTLSNNLILSNEKFSSNDLSLIKYYLLIYNKNFCKKKNIFSYFKIFSVDLFKFHPFVFKSFLLIENFASIVDILKDNLDFIAEKKIKIFLDAYKLHPISYLLKKKCNQKNLLFKNKTILSKKCINIKVLNLFHNLKHFSTKLFSSQLNHVEIQNKVKWINKFKSNLHNFVLLKLIKIKTITDINQYRTNSSNITSFDKNKIIHKIELNSMKKLINTKEISENLLKFINYNIIEKNETQFFEQIFSYNFLVDKYIVLWSMSFKNICKLISKIIESFRSNNKKKNTSTELDSYSVIGILFSDMFPENIFKIHFYMINSIYSSIIKKYFNYKIYKKIMCNFLVICKNLTTAEYIIQIDDFMNIFKFYNSIINSNSVILFCNLNFESSLVKYLNRYFLSSIKLQVNIIFDSFRNKFYDNNSYLIEKSVKYINENISQSILFEENIQKTLSAMILSTGSIFLVIKKCFKTKFYEVFNIKNKIIKNISIYASIIFLNFNYYNPKLCNFILKTIFETDFIKSFNYKDSITSNKGKYKQQNKCINIRKIKSISHIDNNFFYKLRLEISYIGIFFILFRNKSLSNNLIKMFELIIENSQIEQKVLPMIFSSLIKDHRSNSSIINCLIKNLKYYNSDIINIVIFSLGMIGAGSGNKKINNSLECFSDLILFELGNNNLNYIKSLKINSTDFIYKFEKIFFFIRFAQCLLNLKGKSHFLSDKPYRKFKQIYVLLILQIFNLILNFSDHLNSFEEFISYGIFRIFDSSYELILRKSFEIKKTLICNKKYIYGDKN